MNAPIEASADETIEEYPITFASVLLRTPFGALLLATLGSIPAAALTVGVQNWGDLLRRAPWWFLGVVIAMFLLGAGVVIAVHPSGRRIATWTLGWILAAPSALYVFLFAWVFVFRREDVNDWRSWAVAMLFFVVLMVVGLAVAGRRVQDENDPRLLRSAQAAKGFLIPSDGSSSAILERLEEMSQELTRMREASSADPLHAGWSGPGWLGRLAARRGWLTTTQRFNPASNESHT